MRLFIFIRTNSQHDYVSFLPVRACKYTVSHWIIRLKFYLRHLLLLFIIASRTLPVTRGTSCLSDSGGRAVRLLHVWSRKVKADLDGNFWWCGVAVTWLRRNRPFHLEEQERNSGPPRISFAPSGHPELSDGRVAACSSARLSAVSRRSGASIVVSVASLTRWASARRQSPEVQIVLHQKYTDQMRRRKKSGPASRDLCTADRGGVDVRC